jgi:Zn ribbon nucleic-acid-binding protein
MKETPLWIPWLRLALLPTVGEDRSRAQVRSRLGGVCPHCTNTDTLSLHCDDDRCGWVSCTCGALVYSRRRHRHPRHGSEQDTCHDPRAAA